MNPSPGRRWSDGLGNLAVLLGLFAVAAWLQTLHDEGSWLPTTQHSRWLAAASIVAAYAGFVLWTLWRTRDPVESNNHADTASSFLVVWASQTGFARELAQRSAAILRDAGMPAQLLPIDRLDAAILADSKRVLFVVSTTGEGDPPDHALAFAQRTMTQPARLECLQYAILALGDRGYEHFCAFGHELDDWLRRHGAQALFDLVEVDNAETGALRHWQHHLGLIGGVADLPDWAPPRYEHWVLSERRELNPGSAGAPVFHLALTPPAGIQPQWQAGDIAEIGPRHPRAAIDAWTDASGLDMTTRVKTAERHETLAEVLLRSQLPDPGSVRGLDAQAIADALQPLPHREYSIASLPADGSLQILLRRMLRPDGSPGIGSGWLCDHAPLGGDIALRIRENPNFHAPAAERPLILVGNGTGIAGLRALLKTRIASGAHRNWLLFGERNRERDFFHGDEILEWHANGGLERLDLAFSRDQAERVYVQDRLRDASASLREWIADGAAIYVCGSLAGMAPAIDTILREALGDAQVETLLADGRYRRDVY